MEEFISQLFEVVIYPLILLLGTYFIQFIRVKIGETKEKVDNEMLTKYLDLLSETIVDCVLATQQTYVESLKASGKFTHEAQLEAFERTYQSVFAILSKDCIQYLTLATGDLETLISHKIEAVVKEIKI